MRKFVWTMYYNNNGAAKRSWFSDTLAVIANSRLATPGTILDHHIAYFPRNINVLKQLFS